MPKPTKAFHALLVMAVISVGIAHAQTSELQTQVEALLESGPFEILGAHIAYPNVIYAFYSQRGFRTAWSNAQTASELRRALKDSEADGLDPRDYHLPILGQLAAAHGTQGNDSTLAAYEILHTDALLPTTRFQSMAIRNFSSSSAGMPAA